MNYKQIIAKSINLENYSEKDLESFILPISDNNLGDYCLPCFQFSKSMRKAPQIVAQELKESMTENKYIEKVEVVGGYLNFFLNKKEVSVKTIEEVLNEQEQFFKEPVGNNQTVCIDYSSVNLAKYMHIGHLSTTMIGESLARMLEHFGYKVVRINYVGDYGTPFGKMIAAYYKWGKKEEVEARGIDAIQDLYVKFSRESETDESLLVEARQIFKNIEAKQGKDYEIYKWFLEISLKEAKRLLDYLGITFDSWKGEASYSDDLPGVVKQLEDLGLITLSQGAKIVDLEDYNLGVCLIQKSDGTSLYATRDIAAAISRYEDYHFNKMFYVTAVQQKQHFQQFFKVLELMKQPFSRDLEHIYYGMFSLPNAKIASRKGKQAVLVDLFELAEQKVAEVIKEKEFDKQKEADIKQKIAKATLIYNAIKNDRNKDSVFDTETAFSFEGDTAPYMLYSYARMKSILRKYNEVGALPDYSVFENNVEAFELIKNIISFKETLLNALENREPSLVCKKVMDLSKGLNKFYTVHKVLDGNDATTQAKINLIKAILVTLKLGLNLMCIEPLEEM